MAKDTILDNVQTQVQGFDPSVVYIAIDSNLWVHGLMPIMTLVVGLIAGYWAKQTLAEHKLSAKNAIEQNRLIAKQRATMEYLMTRSRDDQYVESYRLIDEVHRFSNIDIKCFGEEVCDVELDKLSEKIDRQTEPVTVLEVKLALSYLLNQYEYMAVAVEGNVYDEGMLIESTKGSTVKMFEITESYVKEARKARSKRAARPKMYENFENLTARWASL